MNNLQDKFKNIDFNDVIKYQFKHMVTDFWCKWPKNKKRLTRAKFTQFLLWFSKKGLTSNNKYLNKVHSPVVFNSLPSVINLIS